MNHLFSSLDSSGFGVLRGLLGQSPPSTLKPDEPELCLAQRRRDAEWERDWILALFCTSASQRESVLVAAEGRVGPLRLKHLDSCLHRNDGLAVWPITRHLLRPCRRVRGGLLLTLLRPVGDNSVAPAANGLPDGADRLWIQGARICFSVGEMRR